MKLTVEIEDTQNSTLKNVADNFGVKPEKLWDLYKENIKANFFQDLWDIAKENEKELKGEE